MIREYVNVYIEWINKQINYVDIPQKGIKFCPQVRFEKEGATIPKWTAEIIIRKWGENASCYAEFKYLFEGAPLSLLKKGNKFELFDGPNEIAKGEVLEDF